ncbi:hypothetical protein DSO57_1027915 [Entomophthora muscae]|uniref:Uncharacterized protein n=1 Tax=Entomophthora muscae TaxID=34485 RepID=A0ACC2S3E1_9FUNG|nr:hypothetical protein DSO57_1027915 [Entomophthora muscae]
MDPCQDPLGLDTIKDSDVVIMTELRAFKMTGTIEDYIVAYKSLHDQAPNTINFVVNCAINAILIWPLNSDICKYLAGFTFDFWNSLPSVNGSVPIYTHSRIPYLPLSDPGMTSSQNDSLNHSVYLMSDHPPLSTI